MPKNKLQYHIQNVSTVVSIYLAERSKQTCSVYLHATPKQVSTSDAPVGGCTNNILSLTPVHTFERHLKQSVFAADWHAQ